MKEILDNLQEKILNFLDYHKSSEESITLRNIADAIWLDHPQKVANKLEQLEKKGFIKKQSNGFYQVIKRYTNDTIYLPLFGFAQCGIKWPEIVDEYPKSYLPFPTSMIKNSSEDLIAVKAKWKSMEPIIKSWDVLIIQIQSWFDSSDKVLLSHNNEAKVKQIKKKNNHYYLHSLNNNFEDMEIAEENEIHVIWVVKKVIQDF